MFRTKRGYHFRILQEHLFFCVCRGKILDAFWQFQSIQEDVVISVCCIAAHSLDLELAALDHLVEHASGNLIFGGKCMSLRDMTFLTQLRKLITKPFLRNLQFIVHKPITIVTRRPQYCHFTPTECFPFFTKLVSSTDSIPAPAPICLERSSR